MSYREKFNHSKSLLKRGFYIKNKSSPNNSPGEEGFRMGYPKEGNWKGSINPFLLSLLINKLKT